MKQTQDWGLIRGTFFYGNGTCSWAKLDTWRLLNSHHFSRRTQSKALAEGHVIISKEEAKDENKQVFTRVLPFCCIINLECLVVWKLVVPVRRWPFAHWKCWLIIYQRVSIATMSQNKLYRALYYLHCTELWEIHNSDNKKLVTMIVNV